MPWHRRLTTTQQMKNQSSDMAGYLFFTVLFNGSVVEVIHNVVGVGDGDRAGGIIK